MDRVDSSQVGQPIYNLTNQKPCFSTKDKAYRHTILFCSRSTGTGNNDVQYISTRVQLSDPFTKPLPNHRFTTMRDLMNVLSMPY